MTELAESRSRARKSVASRRPRPHGRGYAIALALTWDGARWPTRTLPAKARAFLGQAKAPSSREMAAFFSNDRVKELRICWVPRLKGGPDVLSESFPSEKRVGFKASRTIAFDDTLGVVYRRNKV